ncbi:MAG: hypothetical protein NVSMB23_30980 [Myxococcales bacterium]
MAAALAACLSIAGAARADRTAAPRALGGAAPGTPLRLEAPARFADPEDEDEVPARAPRRRRREAREGLIFSLGIGGAQSYLSGVGHAAGFAVDLRMGYGFSDRFQLFFDLSALPASYGLGREATSWTGTIRGQTVLFGDRLGNGLNLNLGVGLGGIDSSAASTPFVSTRAGLALAGGLSLDLRVSPWFAISPELLVQWHQVPNDFGRDSDVHRALGGQVSFVWYGLE